MIQKSGRNSLVQIVHVIPVGYEFERVIAPFQSRAADKIILVADQSSKSQIRYTEKVKAYFEKIPGVSVVVEYADMFRLPDVVRVLSGLIRSEKEAGNTVFVNASSAGRLASIGAAFAGMAHDVNVYYVKAYDYSTSKKDVLEYGVSRCSLDDPEVDTLINYRLDLISKETAVFLEFFHLSKNCLDREWLTYADIADFLHQYKPEEFKWDPCGGKNPYKRGTLEYERYRNEKWLFNGKFNKTIGPRLEVNKYIERRRGERNTVFYRITPTGEYALFMSGISGMVRVEKGKIVYGGR